MQKPFRNTDNTIWLLDARKVAPHVALALDGVLTDASRAARARYVRGAARTRFTASRALLRYAVAQFAQRQMHDVTIIERVENVPHVDISDHAAVRISMSHSGSWIACATSADAVGLDIECTSKSRDLTSMSEWFFTPDEHQWFLGQGTSRAIESFYRLWTGKEAVFKLAFGLGWRGALSSVHFTVRDNTLGASFPIHGTDVNTAFLWIENTIACSIATQATQATRDRDDPAIAVRVVHVDPLVLA